MHDRMQDQRLVLLRTRFVGLAAHILRSPAHFFESEPRSMVPSLRRQADNTAPRVRCVQPRRVRATPQAAPPSLHRTGVRIQHVTRGVKSKRRSWCSIAPAIHTVAELCCPTLSSRNLRQHIDVEVSHVISAQLVQQGLLFRSVAHNLLHLKL